MTKGESFIKNAKCKHGHRSAMSNSAWCDLNKTCTFLKLHDMCHNLKCNFQKQITFTPKQFQLEGNGFENTMKNIFGEAEKSWNIFIKPRLKIATPIISAGVGTKTNHSQSVQNTSNISKLMTVGKILSLTDMHGHNLRLKLM